MDKQQAAEAKYPYPNIPGIGKHDARAVRKDIDKYREGFIAGLEALQSPTDAVAHTETINLAEIEGLLREYYTKNKDGKGGGYGLRLLKSITGTVVPQPFNNKMREMLQEVIEKLEKWEINQNGPTAEKIRAFLIETSDESGAEVFTREDMTQLFSYAYDRGSRKLSGKMDEYMNENYPSQK